MSAFMFLGLVIVGASVALGLFALAEFVRGRERRRDWARRFVNGGVVR